MILVRVALENYKQYASCHTVEFPEEGVVAVIGANGVGKTTLFEAIEWCLYNPREIANEEVPPHNGTGATMVAVTLADPETGDRWVVERRLRKNRVDAEIYKEDDPGTPVVQGTRQVTDYVERRLIGLPHKAFVSTFFTRQKELTFFGSDRPTERRREIARLLGHDTIRTAQELIAGERRSVDAEATALAGRVAAISSGRDFEGETATATDRLATATSLVEAAEREQLAAAEALVAAADELEALRAVEKRDGEARRVQERIESDVRTARVMADNAQRNLGELDEAARVRSRHAAVAAGLPEHERAVARHEAERERARQAADLRERTRQAGLRLDETSRKLGTLVRGVGDGQRIDGWVWTTVDAEDPRTGARRLLTVVAALATEDACQRAAGLVRCRTIMAERDRARRTLETYQDRRDTLEQDRQRLLANGDPRQALETARAARTVAMEEVASASALAQTARLEAARAERIVSNLRRQRLDEPCPTCYRPFDPDDVAATVGALERQRAAQEAEAAASEVVAEKAGERAKATERAERAAAKAIEEVAKAEGAIEKSKPYLEDAKATAEAQEIAVRNGLLECGFSAEPTAEEVDEAERYAMLLQALEKAGGVVSVLEMQAAAAERARDEADALLAGLGAVAYDAPAHEATRDALGRARAAVGAIAEIDRRLAERPRFEHDRESALADLARLAEEAVGAEAARVAIGFDPVALVAAAEAETVSRTRERTATTALGEARQRRQDAGNAHDRLLAEVATLREVTERAETRRRDAGDLDRMQKEFGRFDQYVAALVGPILADRTGEFLAEVTDGKYNRVIFDQDYGLRIYDEDDAFPVERFSGGERDVAALCARLALSTMIGAQAAHPPRFAVLDEVFGSLDEDRRTQVLGTLGKLAETSEALRQLFIISHVEDVHSSPVVSEVWRVTEVDGVSHVQQDDRREQALSLARVPELRGENGQDR